jgi:hypothetical protein
MVMGKNFVWANKKSRPGFGALLLFLTLIVAVPLDLEAQSVLFDNTPVGSPVDATNMGGLTPDPFGNGNGVYTLLIATGPDGDQHNVLVNGTIGDYSVLGGASIINAYSGAAVGRSSDHTVTVGEPNNIDNTSVGSIATGKGTVIGGFAFLDNGTVSANQVTINGEVGYQVMGGFLSNKAGQAAFGAVTGNKVTINSGAKVGSAVFGGQICSMTDGVVCGQTTKNTVTNSSTILSNNTINMTGGEVMLLIGGRIYGAFSATNNVGDVLITGNQVNITGGTIKGRWVIGGEMTGIGTISSNQVIVEGAKFDFDNNTDSSNIIGGLGTEGVLVEQNKVQIKSLTNNTSNNYPINVYGGKGESNSRTNMVTLEGGVVTNIFGGYSSSTTNATIEVKGNQVSLSAGQAKNATAGYANAMNATINGNIINITGGEVTDNIYGGYADTIANNAIVTNNQVNLSATGKAKNATAGYANATGATIDGNIVTVTDGVATDIFGGFADSNANNSTVTNNQVSIEGGQVKSISGGNTNATGTTINNNLVSITGGEVYGINGGYASISANNAKVLNNQVIVSRGQVNNVAGGVAEGTGAQVKGNLVNISNNANVGGQVIGGQATSGTVSENVINFSGANVTGQVVGGYSAGTATVEGNKINVNSGANNRFTGTVDAGYSTGSTTTGSVKDNVITIAAGTSSFKDNVSAGRSTAEAANISGNQLIINAGNNTFEKEVKAASLDGTSTSGTVNQNAININGGTNVLNGTLTVAKAGDQSTISNNTLLINDGNNTFTDVQAAHKTGTSNAGNILNNEVTVKKGTNKFVGSLTVAKSDNHSVVFGNKLTIEDGNNTYNNTVSAASLTSNSGSASSNSVDIKGGVNTFKGDLSVVSNSGSTASNNSLTIDGGNNKFNTVSVVKDPNASSTDNTLKINNGTNVFDGFVNVGGNLIIDGGVNTFNSNVETNLLGPVNSDININGGTNSFGKMVTANRNININGGSNTFSINKVSASEAINFNQAVLNIKGNSVELNAKTVSFTNNSQVNLLQDSKNLEIKKGSVYFENTRISYDSQGTTTTIKDEANTDAPPRIIKETPMIEAKDGSIDFGQGVWIDLAPVNGTSNYWVDQNIMSSNQSITNYNAPSVLLYDLAVRNVSGTSYLYVANRVPIPDVITNLEEFEDLPITGNFLRGVSLIDEIDRTNQNPILVASMMVYLLETAQKASQTNDPHLLEMAARQLIGESIVNVGSAVNATTLKTQGVVYGRLDRIRDSVDTLTPPAAGSGAGFNRLWAGGFGVWADEDYSRNVYGYDYSAGGVSLGYDRLVDSVPGLTMGISGALSKGDLDNKDSYTRVDIDTVGVGLYGSYAFADGMFVDGNFSYSHSKNNYVTNVITGGQKHGDFSVNTFQFGLRTGTVYNYGTFTLIPSIGLMFLNSRQNAFTESVTGTSPVFANWYSQRNDHQIDIPLLLKVNTTFDTGSARITPELRLGWTFVAKKPENTMSYGFVGSNFSAINEGIKPKTNLFQVGAGLKVNAGSYLDVFFNYDLEAAKGFRSHNASAGLGFEF